MNRLDDHLMGDYPVPPVNGCARGVIICLLFTAMVVALILGLVAAL